MSHTRALESGRLSMHLVMTALLAGATLPGCASAPQPAPSPSPVALARLTAEPAGDVAAFVAPDVTPEWTVVEASTPFNGRQDTPRQFDEYRNHIRPYLWMAGLEGDVTARGNSAEVDESFSDILDQLDLALMLAYERKFDGWSLLMDLFYTKLEEDAKILNTEIDSTIEMAYLEVSGAFDVGCEWGIQPIVGLRTWYSSVELEVGAGDTKKSGDWVDPLVGARWLTPLSEDWQLSMRGDVGGFGIGSGSKLSWQAWLGAIHQISERTALAMGYRYLSLDLERGSGADESEMDVALSGLIVGLDYRF